MDDHGAPVLPHLDGHPVLEERAEHDVGVERGDRLHHRLLPRRQLDADVMVRLTQLDPGPLAEPVERRAEQEDLHDATCLPATGRLLEAGDRHEVVMTPWAADAHVLDGAVRALEDGPVDHGGRATAGRAGNDVGHGGHGDREALMGR